MALTDKLSAIGNAIREKTGKTDLIPLADMPDEILGISGGGEGTYEQGKQDERDNFWKSLLNNRNDLSYAFYGWKSDAFYPTYDIGGTNMSRTFYFFGNSDGKLIDLKARCEECRINLDFTKAADVQFCFGSCEWLYTLPKLEFVKVNTLNSVFNNCKRLKLIEKVVLKEDGTQTFTANTFNCAALEEIRFEGVIGTEVTFQYCSVLSKDSINSIISCLSDTTTGQTVLFSKTAINNAFGIDVDDIATYTDEFNTLINSKNNWEISFQ